MSVEKSNIFFSSGTNFHMKRKIKDLLEFKEMGTEAVYLRNSLIFSMKSEKNRFLALRAWTGLCSPKEAEGLEFRRFHDINLAMLAKFGWNIATDKDWLWVKLFKAKGILSALPILRRASYFKIGDGYFIHPWRDLWILWLPNTVPKTKENIDEANLKVVADLRSNSNLEWNQELISCIYDQESAEAIMKTDWLSSPRKDKRFWMGNAEEQVGKAHARASELEKQATIEAQQKEKEALEARANEAEKKIKELGSTIEKVLESALDAQAQDIVIAGIMKQMGFQVDNGVTACGHGYAMKRINCLTKEGRRLR
ncbi:hypothetical protein FNV43_RR01706 [Rhamnella rubrinervis]|uniref:Uncharacterized protein n=1 Tax=Rhamnella rubrinervis TaxID=2594499 RepID=A0A8K0HSX3_9ROSA|nr:hypothetical protein FNV43_RR01706 [Rhamnella rubrinervis]